MLGLRFKGDKFVPKERFDFLREQLGDAFVAVELDDERANPNAVMKNPHSVTTEHLIDEQGQPTRAALDQVLDLFRRRLVDRTSQVTSRPCLTWMSSLSEPDSPGCTCCTNCARLGFTGAGVRDRRRRRRHVVLEPLSGRALRRRKHGVLVQLRRRPPAGVGVDRALRAAARDRALRQPRGRSLRPAQGHHVQHEGHRGHLRRRRQHVDGHDRPVARQSPRSSS